MGQANNKEKKYLASIILGGAGGISAAISPLSVQTSNSFISIILKFLSWIYIYLFGAAVIAFLAEFTWRHWLRAKLERRKEKCIEGLRKEIQEAVKMEMTSYQKDLQEIKEGTQLLCSATSEPIISNTVKEKITDPIHQNIRQQAGEIVSQLSDSVVVPVRQSVEMSREIHVSLKEKNFIFLQTDATPLETFMNSHRDISRILIICYGRNGYNQAFRYIDEHKKAIECDIIVCNPKRNQAISAVSYTHLTLPTILLV